ncbi:MAG: DUF4399 domain-containing protein [Woeseiaceae bacterium]|nr:DUF4399 domain-containing protein [Woeseiaceae bacterium]
MTLTRILPIAAIALLVAACGQKEATPVAAEEPAAAEPAAQPALPRSDSAEGASVFFITPTDGDTVSNPVKIEFGIEGMSVVAAGVEQMHSGHHHLIINADLPENLGMPIPADQNYVHFGDGSTSTEVTLEPGQHTLQLLLGDHLHIPHDPPVTSDKITITVE